MKLSSSFFQYESLISSVGLVKRIDLSILALNRHRRIGIFNPLNRNKSNFKGLENQRAKRKTCKSKGGGKEVSQEK
jgi:hypothetical protein